MYHHKKYPLNFYYAYKPPLSEAQYRVELDDFYVYENLGFIPEGKGEHIYIHVKKRNQNTQWLAKEIAGFVGVSARDVGYCGLKDRFADTTQWFSIYAPKVASVNWKDFSTEGVNVLNASRHKFKLKPGMHASNDFSIRLRNISCLEDIKTRLDKVKQGVPNYFGEQRFGINGNNLEQAESLLIHRRSIRNKKMRGLIISAARSYLFNSILSERVKNKTWQSCLDGEPEIFPTAPLWGRGRSLSSADALGFEAEALRDLMDLASGLEHVGLNQERRPLICVPQNFQHDIEIPSSPQNLNLENTSEENSNEGSNGCSIVVRFTLSPGQYATSILREIAKIENYQRRAI